MARKGILTGKYRESVPTASLTESERETLVEEKIRRFDAGLDLFTGEPLTADELKARDGQ